MRLKQKLGTLKRSFFGRLKNRLSHPTIPKKLKNHTLGFSLNGRHVDYYRLGSGPIKVLFLSGIHGNEVGTVKLNCTLLNHLNRHKKNYEDFSFFFIPCLNPDGYLEAQRHPDYKNGGRIGRLNAHQVDLNRNFPTKNFHIHSLWSHGKNYEEKTKVYCGKRGASERETKALLKLLHDESIRILFSFHNVAEDLCSARDTLSAALAEDYAHHTGFYNMPHQEWKKLDQTGTLKDWCDENHVSFLEIEGSMKATRWGSDWGRQKKALLSALAKICASGYNAANDFR